MKAYALLVTLFCASRLGADYIPADVWPGFSFTPLIQDSYATGEAMLIAGAVTDEALADGQILLQFVPSGAGEEIQVFINLEGLTFRSYHVFSHDAAGGYSVNLFAGVKGSGQLDYVATFDGFAVLQSEGPIFLPRDFFSGIELDAPLSTQFSTKYGVSFAGRVLDAVKADGQVLFNFVADSGEELPVFVRLAGLEFRRGYLFPTGLAGSYKLEVYLGGVDDSSLAFVGSYPVVLIDEGVPEALPVDFFTGVIFDQPLPIGLSVERDLTWTGSAIIGVRSLRLDINTSRREFSIKAPVEEGRFSASMRLDVSELGPVDVQLVREVSEGLFDSGTFTFNAAEPGPAGTLDISALAIGLLPGQEQRLELTNVGAGILADMQISTDDFFSVLSAPSSLNPGQQSEVVVRYDGQGGDHGSLIFETNDPHRPTRQISLNGLVPGQVSLDFPQSEADADGHIELELDLEKNEYGLVLYAGKVVSLENGMRFPFSIGRTLPAARRATLHNERSFDVALRAREQEYAERYRHYDGPLAKRAHTAVSVGEQRTFFFPAEDGVPAQRVTATLVAITERALGWIQDDLRPHQDNVNAADIAHMLELFSDEDYARTIAAFGRPSDVDADGRISVLFTHLVDNLDNVAGFYASSSVLPVLVGGDGNIADMLFISPTRPLAEYRSLLVHELQHLINFNEHVLVRRGEAEVTWLNEGLSHLAEDLVASHSESGNGSNIADFLRDPEAVSLEPEAIDDTAHRGAAYLFVRSLVDRMGPGVVLRLVATGLADRANIEMATGENFTDLMAAWGAQLYASGLGLNDHPRFNFASSLLREGEDRGFALPSERRYTFGGSPLLGSVPMRGLSFVRVSGVGRQQLDLSTDPQGRIGVVAIPLGKGFTERIRIPANYVPGVRFIPALPAEFITGHRYEVSGEFVDDGLGKIALGFVGADTLDLHAERSGDTFSAVFELSRSGAYELNFFTGSAATDRLNFAASFGPVWVRDQTEPTAVAVGADGLPAEYALESSYPNPFNASTVVPLVVPNHAGNIVVRIYNGLGQSVRTLHAGGMKPGRVQLVWDGRDDRGQELASGVYLIRMEAPEFAAVQRAVLLR